MSRYQKNFLEIRINESAKRVGKFFPAFFEYWKYCGGLLILSNPPRYRYYRIGIDTFAITSLHEYKLSTSLQNFQNFDCVFLQSFFFHLRFQIAISYWVLHLQCSEGTFAIKRCFYFSGFRYAFPVHVTIYKNSEFYKLCNPICLYFTNTGLHIAACAECRCWQAWHSAADIVYLVVCLPNQHCQMYGYSWILMAFEV